MDLTTFTKHFNGGGHKSAAGGKIFSKDVKTAIKEVKKVIETELENAYANK